MAQKIFIASTEKQSGKSLVTLGLMSALQGIVPNVGYMKPIGQGESDKGTVDEDADLIKSIFDLKDSPENLSPLSMEEARNNKDALFEKVFKSCDIIEKGKDVVVIEGTDYTSSVAALEFDINAELAHNMVAPVLLIANGFQRTYEEILNNVTQCVESFKSHGCKFLGVIVNRHPAPDRRDDTEKIREELEKRGIPLFGILLDNPVLSGPRLKEVADQLHARVLYRGDDMSKVVTDTKVLAMTPENALRFIKDKDGYLLITSGDRVEHIFTIISAHKSSYFPSYSGIILTGGLVPGDNVRQLIEGLGDIGITVLSVRRDTIQTALAVNGITGEITKGDEEKIEMVNESVRRYVDFERIHEELGTIKSDIVTPRMFQFRILEKARSVQRHIVLPEGSEIRILRAAEEVLYKGICRITLLGKKEELLGIARKNGISLDEKAILDHLTNNDEALEDYAQTLYELRKHKGVTLERARDSVLDPIVYAAIMVYKGEADGYVSGSTHSTADTLRPVLQLIRTKPDVLLASSVFFMCMPNQVLVYADCALVSNPSAEELADIAVTSAETAKSFGIEPVVAMLSYSTGESGKGEDVDKVREATKIARKKRPDILIEGPMQYDAATSPEVALVKSKDSLVAGKATVYIFPDLDAGNTAYKAVQRSANVPAIGPVLQGLNKPANDLSRGATVNDIVYTIAVTAIQAQ